MACVSAKWLNSGMVKLTVCTDITVLQLTQFP
jgi:hypothetical protein